MKVLVQNKPDRYVAEQFLVARKPWPHGVEKDPKGGYLFRVNVSLCYNIENGWWIVDRRNKTEIVKSLKGYDIAEIVE